MPHNSVTVAHFLKLAQAIPPGCFWRLDESPAIGALQAKLFVPYLERRTKAAWIAHIAVADAICYIFGTLGVVWCCSSLGPKLLRFDLRAESKEWKRTWIQRSKLAFIPHGNPSVFRAYTIAQDGLAVANTRRSRAGVPVPVSLSGEFGVKGRSSHLSAPPYSSQRHGRVIGRTEIMIKHWSTAREVADPELLAIPVALFDLYITCKPRRQNSPGDR